MMAFSGWRPPVHPTRWSHPACRTASSSVRPAGVLHVSTGALSASASRVQRLQRILAVAADVETLLAWLNPLPRRVRIAKEDDRLWCVDQHECLITRQQRQRLFGEVGNAGWVGQPGAPSRRPGKPSHSKWPPLAA